MTRDHWCLIMRRFLRYIDTQWEETMREKLQTEIKMVRGWRVSGMLQRSEGSDFRPLLRPTDALHSQEERARNFGW